MVSVAWMKSKGRAKSCRGRLERMLRAALSLCGHLSSGIILLVAGAIVERRYFRGKFEKCRKGCDENLSIGLSVRQSCGVLAAASKAMLSVLDQFAFEQCEFPQYLLKRASLQAAQVKAGLTLRDHIPSILRGRSAF